jgi:hypothetical protein
MAQEMEKEYTLLETWRGIAYGAGKTQKESDQFWAKYFTVEKSFYEKILASDEVVSGTVKELAEKFEARQNAKEKEADISSEKEEKGSVLGELKAKKDEVAKQPKKEAVEKATKSKGGEAL